MTNTAMEGLQPPCKNIHKETYSIKKKKKKYRRASLVSWENILDETQKKKSLEYEA